MLQPGIFLASNIYKWFGTAPEVVALGAENYVQMLTWMLPFVFMKLVFVSALNSAGDTKTPMKVKIGSISPQCYSKLSS